MKSARQPLYFYQFLGAHSLLIGLLPFFLPVYLWTHGLGLAGLSLLIGISGITFSLTLRLWQRWSHRWSLRRLVKLTFMLEILLVLFTGLLTTVPGAALFEKTGDIAPASVSLFVALLVIGFCNGLYNAFFWTSQRTLFLEQLGSGDTGRQYGNFQIFVTVFLKAGILLGGYLLDTGGFVWVLALSAGMSAASGYWLAGSEQARPPLLQQRLSVSSTQALTYKDQRGSRRTFAIDGIFLYLESHFWTLSLFLIVNEDFSYLGIAVIMLMLGFALTFFFIKNSIDRLPIEQLYRAAVLLYTFSWLLRFTLNEDSDGSSLWVTLIVITFFSSFFRLAFNKRFFDVARTEGAVHYLLLKSYSSQWILGLFFSLSGIMLFLLPVRTEQVLQLTYGGAALLSLLYFGYKDHQTQVT